LKIAASVFFVLLVVMSSAFAGEAELSWLPPTARCDGKPLVGLQGYSLLWGQARQELGVAPQVHTIRGLSPGTWWFSLSAIDGDGEQSEFLTVSKTIEPADFKTTSTDVFTIVKRTDRFVLLKVGTAPIGTQCIADQMINGHYVIPRAAVVWGGLVRPDVVVARCG
jgi:hypothetical protein